MKKASLAVASVLALIVTVFAQSTGQRRVGWANTVTELLSLTPSKEAYVYVTKGNLYSTNLDGKILAYDPSSTATVNNTNVWAPDSGIGRWLLISTLNGSGGGGGGAITLTVPDGFGVTGSPLTPPGTLGITTTLTNLAKGTGSGFSNAVASVDYVPPGPIGSSGLTMTGTNLLGRYSSGTGAIQTISVSNGLSFYASQLLGPLNPTDTYIPKRSGSGAFADSPFRIDSTATTYVYTNVDQFEFRNNGAIHLGKDTLTNIVNVYQGTNILLYAFRDINNQGSPFPLVLLSEKDTTNTATSSLDGRIDSTGLGLTRDTNGIQNSIYIRPEYIELNTASASQLSIHGHPDWTSFATAPFFFNSMESDVTSSNLFQLQHIGTNVFLVRGNSGWTGTGTNQLSDDGTFKPSGASVNPTSGYLPYNNAGTFEDSPLIRRGTNTVAIETATATNSTAVNGSTLTHTFTSDGDSRLYLSIDPTSSVFNIYDENGLASLQAYVASSSSYLDMWNNGAIGFQLNPSQIDDTNAAYTFNTTSFEKTSGDFLSMNNHTAGKIFAVKAVSGYTGTGTNFLSDDGTYKAVSGSGGTTINPTDGYVPYRTSSTTFGDSPWYRISTNRLGANSTNSFIWSDYARDNLAIGKDAMASLSSGQQNVAIGEEALFSLDGTSENTAIGSGAMRNNTGLGNTGIGAGALYQGDGNYNVAIGDNSLVSLSTGIANTMVGSFSGQQTTTGSYNVAVGVYSGMSNLVGNYNIIIGHASVQTRTNIDTSVVIGSGIDASSISGITNTISIGYTADSMTNNTARIGNTNVFGMSLGGVVWWFQGFGAPTNHSLGTVTNAPVGSIYSRRDGGSGSSFYVVETSAGNWVAK